MKIVLSYRTFFIVLAILGTTTVYYLSVVSYDREFSQTNEGFQIIHKHLPIYTHDLDQLIHRVDVRFLELLENVSVMTFLIEPRIMLKFLNEQDLELLTKREIDFRSYSNNTNLTTYGIFERESSNINDRLIEMLNSEGYSYHWTKHLDARQFHWDQTKNRNMSVVTHHFFVKNFKVIHLVVFFVRKHFWWLSEVTQLPSEVEEIVPLNNLSFGCDTSAFDVFNLTPVNLAATYPILVPSDPKSFLFEIPTSKFLECNLTIAKEFYSQHSDGTKPNDKFNEKVIEAIKSIKLLVKPFLIPFWVCSGTLLGWYRQCGVIPYTSDVDFAVWSSDYDTRFHEYAQKQHTNLKLKVIYGLPEESFQYAFYSGSLRIDFFFTYKGNDTYWYGGHRPSQNIYFHYIYPPFILCSAELLGYKVLVPCTAEEVIRAEYGKEWKKPVKGWSYDSSAFNIGPKEHWPENVKNKVFVKKE